MLGVIRHIMKKEFLQVMRDKRMFALIFMAPVLQTLLFGFAIDLDLRAQPALMGDLDQSATSRDLAHAIANNDGFHFVGSVHSHDEAEQAVFSGQASLAVLIPKGFEKDLAQGSAEVQVIMDGSDSNTALRAGQEAEQILNQRAVKLQRQLITQALGARNLAIDHLLPELRIAPRAWFNPQMRTAVYFVPALFGLVLLIITMLLTSMGLTREKEIGTLEQIMVSPIRPIELMIGKTLPFAILGLVDVGFLIAIAGLVFDIPVRGSIFALYFANSLFLMTTLGMGLFISTISATQQQAMLTAFFIILPAIMLSGYVYPIENMPVAAQWLTYVNPMRYIVQLTRGIMVKGASLIDMWPQTVALALLGVAVLTGASMRFHKRNA